MPRRGKVVRRPTPPDARYNSVWVQIMINKVMKDGKKSTAERIVYNALGQVGERTKEDPRTVFEQAMRNTMPVLEVRPRRVGGGPYPGRECWTGAAWCLAGGRACRASRRPSGGRRTGTISRASAS